MAYRERKRTVGTYFFVTEELPDDGKLAQYQTFNTVELLDWRTSAGNPQWRKAIANHVSATTILEAERREFQRNPTSGGYSYEYRTIENQAFVWRKRNIRFWGHPWGFKAPTPISTIQSQVALREATKKFFRKVKAMEQEFDGSVFIGELRETVRMLRHPAESLFRSAKVDYLEALRKRRVKDPKNWARGLSGAWLEWAFGVSPLVNDISSAVDAISRLTSDLVKSGSITAVGRDREPVSYNLVNVSHPGVVYYNGSQATSRRQKVKFRGMYRAERTVPTAWSGLERTTKMLGLTLDNFVPTIWELMPWSFLVDYFTNVGDVLEQSFTSLQNVAWCQRTDINDVYVETVLKLDVAAIKAAREFNSDRRNFSCSAPGVDSKLIERYRAIRRIPGGPTVSSLAFELPGSPQKWLNMAALGVQANAVHPQDFKRWGRR